MINTENLVDTERLIAIEQDCAEVQLGSLSITSEFTAPDVDLDLTPNVMVSDVATPLIDNGEAIVVPTATEPPLTDKLMKAVSALTTEQLALVEGYLGLAYSVAREFANRGELIGDLNQVARYGLLKSAGRFDPARGVPFSTFAISYMRGEIKRHFRDYAWDVKVDRKTKELRPRVNKAQMALVIELGREPKLSEIANELHVTLDQVESAILANSAYSADSLDSAILADDSEDNIYEVAAGSSDDEILPAENRVLMDQLLGNLSDRHATVLRARYGLRPFDREHTQEEIGEIIGSSQVHAGRLVAAALRKLKDLAGDMTYEELVM